MTSPQCPSCGTPVSVGATACAKCGSSLVGVAIDTTAATSMMSPLEVPTAQFSAQRTGTESEGAATPRSVTAGAPGGGTGGMLTQARMMDALKAATLGDYEILAELGRGGMAIVYLAHDISLDRKVAIKVMSPAMLEGEGAVERFKREARTAGSLSHPHIIPIHAVKESAELLYFVMKFVEGRPLDDVIREKGQLPIQMVVQILSEVAGALAYAHKRGVVHRDVKPANVMLDDEGWAVVTDFGIAKVAQKQALTMTGATVGTPAYMSPEQISATDVTGKSDQYSLGIVGFEMLTGRVPFSANSLMGIFLAQMNDAPPAVTDVRPDCPPQLAKIIQRMMSKTADDRWPSLEDVAAALAPLAKAETRESTRVSMAALARVSDGRPRADDFVSPLSPTPLNAPRMAGAAPSASAPGKKRVPVWAWPAAAVPVLALGAWLVMKDSRNTSQQQQLALRPSDSAVAESLARPVTLPPVGTPATSSQASGVKSSPPLDSTVMTKRPASGPPAAPLANASKPSGDTARAQAAASAKETAPVPALPTATPAGGARVDSAPPADPNAGAPAFTEISAGGSTTCGALSNDAGVMCWGAAAVTGAKLEGVLFSKMAVGDGHICGLTPSGEALCWGSNSQGQLGDGSTTERAAPTAVKATQRFTEISVGAGHTCALTGDGTAFCWGGNKFGQLGDGSRSNRNRPVLVRSTAGNQGFQSLAAGGSHSCGITRANKAYCWGDGFSGQVGNAMQDFAVEPFAVKTDLAFRTVVAGDRHTCGLSTSGRAYCWGDNKQGQLGNETKDDRNLPDSVATDQVFRSIAAGGQHTCAISARRTLHCWGNNVDGRLGDGTRGSRTVPTLAASGATFSHVSAGSGHTCGLTANAHAMCWGGNGRGQLGGGSVSPFSAAPVVVRIKGS